MGGVAVAVAFIVLLLSLAQDTYIRHSRRLLLSMLFVDIGICTVIDELDLIAH